MFERKVTLRWEFLEKQSVDECDDDSEYLNFSKLLESGASVESVDGWAMTPSCLHQCLEDQRNLQCWLERVKDWDLNRQNTFWRLCAGPVWVRTTRNSEGFVGRRCFSDYRTHGGGTALTGALENEDLDPDVVRLLLEQFKSLHSPTSLPIVNYKRASILSGKVFTLLRRLYIAYIENRSWHF